MSARSDVWRWSRYPRHAPLFTPPTPQAYKTKQNETKPIKRCYRALLWTDMKRHKLHALFLQDFKQTLTDPFFRHSLLHGSRRDKHRRWNTLPVPLYMITFICFFFFFFAWTQLFMPCHWDNSITGALKNSFYACRAKPNDHPTSNSIQNPKSRGKRSCEENVDHILSPTPCTLTGFEHLKSYKHVLLYAPAGFINTTPIRGK